MDNTTADAPRWVAPFLAALRAGTCVERACREAGVTSSTPYHRRKTDDAFRAEWDGIAVAVGEWLNPASPALPSGGATVDAEARTAIAALIACLEAAGVIAAG